VYVHSHRRVGLTIRLAPVAALNTDSHSSRPPLPLLSVVHSSGTIFLPLTLCSLSLAFSRTDARAASYHIWPADSLPLRILPILGASLPPLCAIMGCLRSSVPARLPGCLPHCLPPCRPACLPTCLPARLPACLPPWLPASQTVCLPAPCSLRRSAARSSDLSLAISHRAVQSSPLPLLDYSPPALHRDPFYPPSVAVVAAQ